MNPSAELLEQIAQLEFVPREDGAKLANLLALYGSDWMTDLLNAEDRKGDGTSPGVVFEIPIEVEMDWPEPNLDREPFQAGTGASFFLDDVDAIFEDASDQDEADHLNTLDWGPFRDVISLWVSQRIDYLRSVVGLNAKEARIQAYEEIQGLDLGGDELLCATCASFFWDNQRRLNGAERDFCSIQCQEKVEKDCITCGTHYVVGRARRGWRNTDRLSGFCTSECAAEHYEKEAVDRAYVYGVKKRFEQYNSPAEFDESVTRRAVFDRDQGKCYICGKATNWVRQGDWDPNLANLDHKIPVSKGGSHTWENVALSCQLCNTRKGARDL